MAVIRKEVTDAVWRAREVVAGAGVALAGIWVAAQGGFLLTPVGLLLAGFGAVWGVTAWRRMRFAQGTDAPGVVEIDEGQIGYLGRGLGGPGLGGFVAIPDLVEIRLVALRGRRLWQLRQADGQALLIPVDATGSERLYDVFASLSGMDTAALVAALEGTPPATQARGLTVSDFGRTLWRRPGTGIVAATRPQ